MAHMNIEIKARTADVARLRQILELKDADFKGIDHQVDTYFNTNYGRLKLREGEIENHLIHYQREDKEGPKQSDVMLFKPDPGTSLKEILTKALGILVVVDKKREIYFIGNVKFHIDDVEKLGTFVEIEAIDMDGTLGREKLLEQCRFYLDLFAIQKEDLIPDSYSDLLLSNPGIRNCTTY